MRIVVVGYDQMFSNLILGSLEAKHKVVGVFRHERVVYNPFILFFKDIFAPGKDISFIKSLKLKEIKARSVNSKAFKKEILKLNPDLILVGSWSEKFKKPIIELPKIGTINCHPSILPKYRGPNPYIQVIIHGETETGITFHLMDEKFDNGPILLQKKINIIHGYKGDTGESLKNKCCNLAKAGIFELLTSMDNEIVIPIKQNDKESSYFPQINEKDILIDFRKTSIEINRQIRALTPWQPAYFPHKNIYFKVKEHEVIENKSKYNTPGMILKKNKNSLWVVCGDNKVIVLKNLKLFGAINKFFTSFYIKFFVRCKDICK